MREPSESESAYISRRFKEAMDEEDLGRIEDELGKEGLNKDNIRRRKSERRKELRQGGALAPVQKGAGTLSAEQIVAQLPWPVDNDGRVSEAFRAGQIYESMNVIRGIRLAQELSKMGIDQATPVIKMATEMRQAESKAASEAAQAAAAGVGQLLQPHLQEISSKMVSQAPNPFANVMAQAMQPMIMQAFGGIARALFPGQVPQPGGGQPQGQPPVGFQQSPQPAEPKQPPLHIPPEEADQWTEA